MLQEFFNIESIIDKSKRKLQSQKNKNLKQFLLDIEEYEKIENAYDMMEKKRIETILENRTIEDIEISHTKKKNSNNRYLR